MICNRFKVFSVGWGWESVFAWETARSIVGETRIGDQEGRKSSETLATSESSSSIGRARSRSHEKFSHNLLILLSTKACGDQVRF